MSANITTLFDNYFSAGLDSYVPNVGTDPSPGVNENNEDFDYSGNKNLRRELEF